jgi:hypothetical protein
LPPDLYRFRVALLGPMAQPLASCVAEAGFLPIPAAEPGAAAVVDATAPGLLAEARQC